MLIDVLRARLGDPTASSFQLMGEDLQLLTVEDLRTAVVSRERVVPEVLYEDLMQEEHALAADSHGWLKKYNRSMYGRIAGYLELGRRLEFHYPWPVVAILGIVQVLAGMDRVRVFELAGRVASRLGYDDLERLGDGSEDVLRRTNRGIFADSVPTVLRAVRATELRAAGKADLAEAMLDGIGAVLWDGESAALCRGLADGLAITDEETRFRELSSVTRRHFSREQAIFTHHIASKNHMHHLPEVKALPAPVIAHGKLTFRPYALPRGFDFRDHDARVDTFARAFVTSVTGSLSDYHVATDWVVHKFTRH
jgi:hypothetical protein